ncbi:MAG TPA: glycosyltransferase family 9 protein [Gemmatimonadaceae bacterium]
MSSFPSRANFRDRRHYVLAVGSELVAPALRIVARRLSRGAPTDPQTWRRALIVGHGHIGDVLCQTVSLDSLARGLPECRFDYLTTPLAAEVLVGNPAITHILPWNSDSRPNAITADNVLKLRAFSYDAILCTNVVRHQEALRLAFELRIPNRVAFVHRGLSGLVTLPVHLAAPTTPAAQSRLMAEAITGQRDMSETRPRVFPSANDVAHADAEWVRLGLKTGDFVVICSATTRQRIGNVPREFFESVLSSVQRIAPHAKIVLTGSGDDAPVLNAMATALGNGVVVSAGNLSLLGFAALLSRCSVHFCMDSGPRHLANAVGTPVVFTRNLAVRASEAGAYCPTEIDVMPDASYLRPDQIAVMLSTLDRPEIAATIVRYARPVSSR